MTFSPLNLLIFDINPWNIGLSMKKDGQYDFLAKVVFKFEKSKFSIFRRIYSSNIFILEWLWCCKQTVPQMSNMIWMQGRNSFVSSQMAADEPSRLCLNHELYNYLKVSNGEIKWTNIIYLYFRISLPFKKLCIWEGQGKISIK